MLILTAFSQREIIEQARDSGALAYLVKPFQKSDLIPRDRGRDRPVPRAAEPDGEVDALGEQLESRKIIDRAKGILIDECGMKEQDAFTFIQRTAMSERTGCATSPNASSPARLRPDLIGGRSAMAKLLLLDGNSLTYRAFFALPTDMATASGQVTNAVFGFTSMFINLFKDHKPDGMLVAFDRPEPTFRHVADPEYKAQREAAPDILRQQMGLVRQVLEALGITQVELAGCEADDIIAAPSPSRARRAATTSSSSPATATATSWSRDPHIKVLYNRRGVSDYALYDEAGIFEKTGVTPAQYPEYAALRGDTSDNLPGVPGVGEKTAAKLIKTYGGLDGIFANVDKQTPKLRASLIEHEDRARQEPRADGASPRRADRGRLRRRSAIVPNPTRSGGCSSSSSSGRCTIGSTRRSATAGSRWPSVRRRGAARRGHRSSSRRREAVGLLGSLDVLDVLPAWAGEPGRSELIGLAVVTDAAAAEVPWIPGELARRRLGARRSSRPTATCAATTSRR